MSGESSAHEQIKRAQALIDLGRQEQAVELLVTIPQTTPLLVAAVNCFLAYAFAGLGKKDEAYACARRALEAEPNTTPRCSGWPSSSRTTRPPFSTRHA